MAKLTRLDRARRAYLRNPTRTGLRVWMRVKARRGRYDDRMFRYYGVSPKVNIGCRRAARRAVAAGLVPTSTLRNNGTGSWHDQRNANGEGHAIDFGLIETEIGTARGRRRMLRFQGAEHRRHRDGELPRMLELIGPDNGLVVLRDTETSLPEGTPLETQHDTHVHEAHR